MKSINKIFCLMLLIVLIAGCSVNMNVPKKSIQTNAENLIKNIDIAQEISSKIPTGSKIVLRSMELDSTVDLPMVALVEDQLTQNLLKKGYVVLERDQNSLTQMFKEKTDDTYSLKLSKKDALMTTNLLSAEYILSYRIIRFDLTYNRNDSAFKYDLSDENNSSWTSFQRDSFVELHFRFIDTKSGKIIYANNATGMQSDNVKFDSMNKDYHYSLFPFETKPSFDDLKIQEWVSANITKDKKIVLRYIESDETEDRPVNATIEDQLIMSLLSGGYSVYERDINTLRQLSQEGNDGRYYLNENRADSISVSHLNSVDRILSYRIQEVNIKNEALIGSLKVYRHGLISLLIRVQDPSTGEIIKSTNLLGTNSYNLPEFVRCKLRDYRFIKFAPSLNPTDPKGNLFYEKISKPDLDNRKQLILRPTINMVRTNKQNVIGAEIDFGLNLFMSSEVFLSASLAGLETNYGYSFHGLNVGQVVRWGNVTFNPTIGGGIADAAFINYDAWGFPIGIITEDNIGLKYGMFLEYHIRAQSLSLGYHGIWTKSGKTKATMLSAGYRF